MQILWELQNELHNILHDRGCASDETAAIVLCVLSFPTLCFQVKEGQPQFWIGGSSVDREGCCVICIEKEGER